MNAEIHCISHVWTTLIITNCFGSENTVWVCNLLVIALQKHCCEYIHLFHYHLRTKQDNYKTYCFIGNKIKLGISSTWTPSTSHRSPTSNGCITNKKMIASKTVLQEFPNTNTANRSWDPMKTRKCKIGVPSMASQTIKMTMPTIMFNMLWSSSTAVFVSFSDSASALLSLKAFTCRQDF